MNSFEKMIDKRKRGLIAQTKYAKKLKSLGIKIITFEKSKEYRLNHKAKYPWEKHYYNAYTRCKYTYGDYFNKKIKFLITKEEIKNIWHRDRAWLLKEPSIDRIDNYGNYEFGNCRFIEKKENSRIANVGRNPSKKSRKKMSESAIKAWARRNL